jgi:hypothetical protein
MIVLEFPPRLSFNNHVSTESLYGMKCPFPALNPFSDTSATEKSKLQCFTTKNTFFKIKLKAASRFMLILHENFENVLRNKILSTEQRK